MRIQIKKVARLVNECIHCLFKNNIVAVYLGVYAALGMGNSIGILVVTLVSAMSAIRAARILHAKMLNAIMRSPMSFFDTTPLGRIVNRFSKDIYCIDETIPRSIRSFITTFLQV